MNKPIAVIITPKEFLRQHFMDVPNALEHTKVYFEKINLMVTELHQKHDWLPDCCRVEADFMVVLPDGNGKTDFYVRCQRDKK